MTKATSLLVMNRFFLISFILLCCVFKSEKAFSQRYWEREDMKVSYEKSDGCITFNFLFYDHYVTTSHVISQSFLSRALIKYSDNNNYIDLVGIETKKQDLNDVMWMNIKKYKGDRIEFPNSIKPENPQLQPDCVGAKISDSQRNTRKGNWKKCSAALMCIKWHLPESCKSIISIRLSGFWQIYTNLKFTKSYKIEANYPIDIESSNSNTLKNNLSVFESEVCDKVMVTQNDFAINVTGAEPGKEIKVYNIAGVEVKSVVSTDDVVNIKLAKNQIYIVKIGVESYKVVL